MICNRSLRIAVFLNSLGNFLVPLAFVRKYTLIEHFFKSWPVRISLALGYLRDIPVLFKVINEAVNKIIFTKNCLAFDLIPN